MTRALLVFLAAGAGCYSPSYRDCEVTCASSQTCPSGLTCSNNYCVASAATSCSTGGDGGFDTNGDVDAVALGPWGTPTPVDMLAPLGNDDDPTVRNDELELYFNRIEAGTNASETYVSKRNSKTASWGSPVIATDFSAGSDGTPDLSYDSKTIYWASSRVAAQASDIWMATRTSVTAPWTGAQAVAELNSMMIDAAPAISNDGKTMVFHSLRSGNLDLYIAERAAASGTWGPPQPLALNDPTFNEESPFLSADKLTIYFGSNKGGEIDLYMATRATVSDPFGSVTPITELNSTTHGESDPHVSTDGRHIWFTKTDAGGLGVLYEAVR